MQSQKYVTLEQDCLNTGTNEIFVKFLSNYKNTINIMLLKLTIGMTLQND